MAQLNLTLTQTKNEVCYETNVNEEVSLTPSNKLLGGYPFDLFEDGGEMGLTDKAKFVGDVSNSASPRFNTCAARSMRCFSTYFVGCQIDRCLEQC